MDSPDIIDESAKKTLQTTTSYQKLFQGQDSDKVLQDLMVRFGVFNGTFDENPHSMYFKEGQRSAVFYILEQIGYDMDKVKKVYEETLNDF